MAVFFTSRFKVCSFLLAGYLLAAAAATTTDVAIVFDVFFCWVFFSAFVVDFFLFCSLNFLCCDCCVLSRWARLQCHFVTQFSTIELLIWVFFTNYFRVPDQKYFTQKLMSKEEITNIKYFWLLFLITEDMRINSKQKPFFLL